jgi:hypothetical protein
MTCREVDELGAAYALGALEADAELAISEHLAACPEPHTELRDAIGVAATVPLGVGDVEPSPQLRGRILATISGTEQDHRIAPPSEAPLDAATTRRAWWQVRPLMAGLAAAAVVVVVALGTWNANLAADLAERDAALAAIASADAAFRATGPAGSGWLLSSDDTAIFVSESLAELPSGRLYALWLIDDAGPVAVGVVEEVDELVLVTLEESLGSATAFALTVESEPVEAPTSEPVLVASLES